ncbi:MAG: hypothetical protein R3D02_09335 [Hyphomicrobiales bacterium]
MALPIAGRSGAFFAGLMMAAAILPSVEARLAKTDAVLLACLLATQGGSCAPSCRARNTGSAA